jgi:hypothetical protein
MFDPTLLQQELAKATDLINKSKSVITDFKSKIANNEAKINEYEATIRAHEATIAANQLEIENSANIVSTVSAISAKFTENFADFEGFLNGLSNANTSRVIPTIIVDNSHVGVSAPFVAPNIVVPPVVETSAVPEPVVEVPVVPPAPVVDHSHEPTRIGPLVV